MQLAKVPFLTKTTTSTSENASYAVYPALFLSARTKWSVTCFLGQVPEFIALRHDFEIRDPRLPFFIFMLVLPRAPFIKPLSSAAPPPPPPLSPPPFLSCLRVTPCRQGSGCVLRFVIVISNLRRPLLEGVTKEPISNLVVIFLL